MVDATQIADVLSSIDPDLAITIIMLSVGMVESARRFRETGKIPYRELPWAAKRELFRWFRKSYFTVDKPDAPYFTVDRSVSEIEEALARQGFTPDWPLSYLYGGEDANLRLYFYNPSKKLPHRQVHVRLFEAANGTQVMCHEEPDGYHHPEEHLASDDMEHEAANEFVKRRLENEVPIGYPA